jgi:hypothetical protein
VNLAPSVAAVVDNRDIPDICLQHMVAVMLIDKTDSFQAAHDKARMQDAASCANAQRWSCCRTPNSPSSCPSASPSSTSSSPASTARVRPAAGKARV